jgi:transcriptional regulator with XRE-family HTH domain
MFDELANELKSAREKNGMTLAQVANKSKIDIKFLEAMEQGDFAFLPDLYSRAFAKNFAKTVGLDVNKFLKKYEAAKQGIPYVEEEPKKEEKAKSVEIPIIEKAPEAPRQKPIVRATKQEIRKKDSLFTFDAVGEKNPSQDNTAAIRRRNLIIGGSLIGVVVVLTLIYFLFIDRGETIIVAEKPIEEVIKQNQRYVEDEHSGLSTDAGSGISDSLVLTINTNDTSWIKVSIDENIPEEFILLPNSQKSIKAKTNYNLTLGNSGAIKLQLNNRPIAFSGKIKSVLNVLVDREGVKYLNNPALPR